MPSTVNGTTMHVIFAYVRDGENLLAGTFAVPGTKSAAHINAATQLRQKFGLPAGTTVRTTAMR